MPLGQGLGKAPLGGKRTGKARSFIGLPGYIHILQSRKFSQVVDERQFIKTLDRRNFTVFAETRKLRVAT